MSKIDDAADQVLGLAERFRGIIEIAEVIKSVGSLDQAITERQAALASVTQAHEAAKAELTEMQGNIQSIRDTQAAELFQFQKDSADVSKQAQEEAINIRSQALIDANALTATTQAELETIRQAHDEAFSGKQAELSDLQSKIDDAQKALDAITAAHTDTLARVEALKAAAKSVLGDA